jgi:predicted transcriptional regulator
MTIIDSKSALSGLKVCDAMRKLVCFLDRNASIQQAIRHTIKYKINAVLIVDQRSNAIGVVSKTNILGAYYVGLPLTTPLEAIMVAPPITCRLNDSLDSALDTMRTTRVHRLYVVAEEPHKVLGVVAYADILGMLYRYCHQCERSTLRQGSSAPVGMLADHFKVCEIMNPAFQFRGEEESLMHLMEAISAARSKTVLIKGPEHSPRGVVSTTDLIIAYMHGLPSNVAAKTIMSTPVISCDYDEALITAVKTMIFYDLNNLYVHKENLSNIVGLVTLADAARMRSGSCRACMISRIDPDI